jgi:hypothetical protein
MALIDKRRFDERVPVNSEPFIFSSAIIDATDAADTTVLKSFTKDDGSYLIMHAGVEIIEAFDGGASLAISSGTMATNTLGTVTTVDAAFYLVTANVTEATINYYADASGSTLFANQAAGTSTVVKGADATVPVIFASLTGTPTVGKARLHVQMVKLPLA